MEKNYGLILENPRPNDFVFGVFTPIETKVLLEDGDWTPYLPTNEKQKNNNFDTWACVSASATNVLEIQFNYLYEKKLLLVKDLEWLEKNGYIVNGKFNFSERFIAKLSNTQIGKGNSLFNVANYIRDCGLIPESMLPFSENMTSEEYYSEISQELKDLGKQFLERFEIMYEWIEKPRFVDALKYSPVQVVVAAWYKNSEGLYYFANKFNHAVCCKKDDVKQIFDTYDPFEKGLTDDNFHDWGMKFFINFKNKTMPTFNPVNNQLYLLVEGPEQKLGMGLNGQVIVHNNKIDAFLGSISREKGYTKMTVPIPVGLEIWNSMKKVDGKGNPIN
jgi:hypothetical protein